MKSRNANAGPLGRRLARVMTGLLGASQGVGATGKGIHPSPITDFSGTPLSGSSPLSVQFTDLTTNSPQFWAWDFGDGGTSVAQNPAHTYAADGTYTVSLNAANESGFDIETKTAYVTAGSSVAWDPTAKRDNTTLSNSNLTASTTSASGVGTSVRGMPAVSTGKHVLRLQYNFGGPPGDEEVECGLATAAWQWDSADPAVASVGFDTTSWAYLADGKISHGDPVISGFPVLASGENIDFLINFDTGKVWLTTPAGTTGDPEAGTGEAFTFTANTALYPAFWAYSDGGTVSAVIDPTYSSGTFGAWG